MLNEFRTRYPHACLISELLQIDHGKYIVRVSVQIEGITVATGLAATDTIEAAEDQARIRAVALLNLNASPTINTQEQNSPKPEIIAQKATVTQPKTDKKAKPPLSITPPMEKVSEPLKPIFEPEEFELTLETPETFSDLSAPEDEDIPIMEDETMPLMDTEEMTSVSPEPSKKPFNEPTDYSDIIARTNVEMKRLGWTSEQGRDYLIGTYGKRSRQLLEDEQLIEFLQYLESLPTS